MRTASLSFLALSTLLTACGASPGIDGEEVDSTSSALLPKVPKCDKAKHEVWTCTNEGPRGKELCYCQWDGTQDPPPVAEIAAGNYSTFARTTDGNVWAWGGDQHSALGDGVEVDQARPEQIVGVGGATQIAADGLGACALVASGAVSCWGDVIGVTGLGSGITAIVNKTPALIAGITGATQIAHGTNHACAVKSDGSVWCWGSNLRGQLGDGSTSSRTNAAAVSGISSAVRVVAGGNTTCALEAVGTVFCWGENTKGQLGNGTIGAPSAFPVEVSGVSFAFALHGGPGGSFCANDGQPTLLCWGNNSNGQLGDGTTLAAPTPIRSTYVASSEHGTFAFGTKHACVAGTGVAFQCWGDSHWGQLGDGTTVASLTPVNVLLTEATQVAVGVGHTCALRPDAVVDCWGYNILGQIGNAVMPVTSAAEAPSPKPLEVNWYAPFQFAY